MNQDNQRIRVYAQAINSLPADSFTVEVGCGPHLTLTRNAPEMSCNIQANALHWNST
jgi:hypothetical protein